MSFATDELAAMDAAREVRIETYSADGRAHRAVIWIVVDGDRVFVRSVRGAAGRWYQRALADPRVRIIVGDMSIEAVARPASDDPSVEATSAGLRRKYRPGRSLDSMLVAHVLPTTLRLEPRDASTAA